MHIQDTDCTVNTETGLCDECGVDHSGGECPECCGRGFHRSHCPLIDADPFDLEKALKGAPLVTRDGRPATGFRPLRANRPLNYEFEAMVDGKSRCFTDRGTYWVTRRDAFDELRERDIRTRVVLPELDDRFFVAMFGRGLPPGRPHFRWCTAILKINPMMKALQELRAEVGEKFLMITGVRIGESAQRDARIMLSCSRDGAECGQGWFQEATPEAVADTLAPLVHWRLCHVWAWLTAHAPDLGFSTLPIAVAYGGAEAEEVNARTGCMECPVAKKDTAVQAVIRQPEWSYLAPIRTLAALYDDLSFNLRNRLRKGTAELRKDGSIVRNPNRLGPLTMEARLMGLKRVLAIQSEINIAARQTGRPIIDLINPEEEVRIHELISLNTWPDKWDGTEIRADELFERVNRDGSVQPLLLQVLEEQ
jgi:DNA sulfur modification protein DndC